MRNLLRTATRRYQLKPECVWGTARGLAVVAMALAGGSSWAANAEVAVNVTAVPDTVSLSRTGLQNYGAIQVTITPTQNNVINQLVFTSNAKVQTVVFDNSTIPPTETVTSSSAAEFKESIPAGACKPSASGDSVTCSQAKARNPDVMSYILIYNSPTSGSRFKYEWTFTYSTEGSAGSNSSSLNSSSGFKTASLTEAISPTQRLNLKTFIPAAGGKFFTGTGHASNPAGSDPGDPSATILVFPNNLGLKVAAVVTEDDGVPGGLSPDTLTTMTTTVSIPSGGFFSPPITVALQRAEATIKTKTQQAADRAQLWYSADTGEPWQPPVTPPLGYLLKNCSDLPGGVPSTTGGDAVCVSQRVYVKNNLVGKPRPDGGTYTSADVGTFIFFLLAGQNGRTSW